MADTLDETPEESPQKPTQSHGKKGAMLVIIVGVLVMVLAPLASWLVVTATINPNRPSRPPKVSANQKQQHILDVRSSDAPIVVNVSGTRMTRVLRIQPHLILSEERLAEDLNKIMPIITDRVMLIASRRTLEQLETVEDREALKRDISNEINAMIRDRFSGTVLDVVFSDFLIQ